MNSSNSEKLRNQFYNDWRTQKTDPMAQIGHLYHSEELADVFFVFHRDNSITVLTLFLTLTNLWQYDCLTPTLVKILLWRNKPKNCIIWYYCQSKKNHLLWFANKNIWNKNVKNFIACMVKGLKCVEFGMEKMSVNGNHILKWCSISEML